MEFLINYAETLGIVLLIGIISLMLWITPPKPWRYYWWGLGFISPLLISLGFHFYFHNPENYPVGLCLNAEASRTSLDKITEDMNKVNLQIKLLIVQKNKSQKNEIRIEQLQDELKILESDQTALTKNPKDNTRIRELMIVYTGADKNYFVEWDREIKRLKLKENFVYQKTKTLKFIPINCPKDLKKAAKPYIQKKEPPLKWLYKYL